MNDARRERAHHILPLGPIAEILRKRMQWFMRKQDAVAPIDECSSFSFIDHNVARETKNGKEYAEKLITHDVFYRLALTFGLPWGAVMS